MRVWRISDNIRLRMLRIGDTVSTHPFMSLPSETLPARTPGHAAAELDAQRAVKSESLLGGTRELLIDHRGVVYRLKLTSLGKLILTK